MNRSTSRSGGSVRTMKGGVHKHHHHPFQQNDSSNKSRQNQNYETDETLLERESNDENGFKRIHVNFFNTFTDDFDVEDLK